MLTPSFSIVDHYKPSVIRMIATHSFLRPMARSPGSSHGRDRGGHYDAVPVLSSEN